MTKAEFLSSLDRALAQLPLAERQKALDYYEEILDDRMEDGMTEEDAVASMEPIPQIAQQVLDETPLPVLMKTRVQKPGMPLWLTVLLLVLGSPVWLPLLIAFAVVILVFYLCIWIIIGCVWIVGAAFALCLPGAIWSILMIHPTMVQFLFLLGIGFAGIGGALLLFFPIKALSAQLVRLTAWLGRRCKRIFIRKERG